MHDQIRCNVEEAKVLEARLKEILNDVVKSFLKVKFESHANLYLLRSFHVMYDILQNNNIVGGASTWQKTALVGTNKSIHDGSKEKYKDFADDFVNNVAKSYWSKIFVSDGRLNFWDEYNNGIKEGRIKITCLEGCFHKLENVFSTTYMYCLKKMH